MRRTSNKASGKEGRSEHPRTSALDHPREDEKRTAVHWDEPTTAFAAEEPASSEMDEDAPSALEAHDDENAPDDALGLYLRQMGAIPLLNREQELALAKRLEVKRSRYRRAALLNWRTLRKVTDTFGRIHAGQLPIDPNIDVVTTLNLSRDKILARLPHNLTTLQRLLARAETQFADFLRERTTGRRARMRRELWRLLTKSVKLAEELSPRIELLDKWTDELVNVSSEMTALQDAIDVGNRSAADRERSTRLNKQ
ncbi:MAG TPA: sigma-70 factor domain-containing protein, partial [Gemmataceae bacterium]|nr:sigma-70 factor domain-containing protein [Gemmataceae bacterium]